MCRPKHFAVATAAIATFATQSAFPVEINNTRVDFASVTEARHLLTAKDEFIGRLSSFDRSTRMRVDRLVTNEEFLAFVGQSAEAWTEEERKRLGIICSLLKARLHPVPLPLPAHILLVKTNGQEEGGAAYTRGSAIVLSQYQLAHASDLEHLICHELFHIISRHHPDLRERLYAALGFERCLEAVLPPEEEARRITNPDAPNNDHFIKVTVDNKECAAVPIVISKATAAAARPENGFYANMELQFLVADNAEDLSRPDAPSRRMVEPKQLSGFFEQVGRNTRYIIHPEEIVADNFALLVMRGVGPSSEVLEKIKAVLMQAKPRSS